VVSEVIGVLQKLTGFEHYWLFMIVMAGFLCTVSANLMTTALFVLNDAYLLLFLHAEDIAIQRAMSP
jgi:hypothetical protein